MVGVVLRLSFDHQDGSFIVTVHEPVGGPVLVCGDEPDLPTLVFNVLDVHVDRGGLSRPGNGDPQVVSARQEVLLDGVFQGAGKDVLEVVVEKLEEAVEGEGAPSCCQPVDELVPAVASQERRQRLNK